MSNLQDQGSPSAARRPDRGKRLIVISAVILLVVAMGGVLWNLRHQIRGLEDRLATADRWAQFIERKLHEAREEVTDLQSRAREARERAAEAREQAEEMTRARRMAELEREFAREETDRALQRAQQSEQELQELRKQREQELNRMQEALSHIAETVRTPMGMVVNLSEDSFLFDFDKTDLRPENREILSRIAGVLLASHGYRLYVYGHTDDIGSDDYNTDLSERRAKAVRDYLVEAGIPAGIINVQGFGKSSPAVESKTRVARQKNRRVEIGVIDTVINYTKIKQSSDR